MGEGRRRRLIGQSRESELFSPKYAVQPFSQQTAGQGLEAIPVPSTSLHPGSFSRSPFLQGLAGGVAGGFLGSMLFGGSGGHAAGPMGGSGGGGIGLFDIIILGLLLYFGYKFYKRWRLQKEGTSFYGDVVSPRIESPYGTTRDSSLPELPRILLLHTVTISNGVWTR